MKIVDRILSKAFRVNIPLWLTVLILSASIVATISIVTLAPEKVNIFTGQVEDTDFVVDAVISKPLGRNIVILSVKLRNTDSITHTANVTVQLLNSTGDVIEIDGVLMEQTKQVEALGGDTVILIFKFKATGLVEKYETYQIIIYQTG